MAFPAQSGAVTDYAIPFDYISKDHIEASVDGASATFTWLNDSTIRMDTAPVGDLVIQRVTPIDHKVVTFVDGSAHTAEKHNLQNEQNLYVIQETVDEMASTLKTDGIKFDARGQRIENVGSPTEPTDASTKGYVDTILDNDKAYLLGLRNATEGFASDAEESAILAANSEDLAEQWAESPTEPGGPSSKSAKTWAETAEQYKNTAVSAKNSAESARDSAQSSASAAATSETNAASSESAAASSESNAESSASAAASSASSAATSEANAATSESNAASSASAAQSSASSASSSASSATTSAASAANSASDAKDYLATVEQQADRAEQEADRAQDIAEAIGDPVAYTPQEKTPAEQEIARENIGLTLGDPMLARLNASKDHSLQDWQDGTATEGGLISPAQLAEAAGDKTAIGTVNWFALSTPPDGWLVCDGRAITNLYPDLRQALIDDGFPWGQDGSGNPLLPNPVDGNRFPRAAGGDLPVGTVQEDAIRNITGKATNVSSWGFAGSENLDGAFYASRTFTDSKVAGQSSQPMIDFAFDASRVVPTADENRPKAVAMLLCIKAFGSVVNIPGQADMDYIIEQTKSYTDDTVSNLPLGYEWIDVIDDRAHDTWYENTTPWPIFVSIYPRSNTTTRRYLEIREGDGDPIKVGSFSASTTPGNNVCVVTHPGWSYRVDGRIGQADPFLWVECRRVS